jgi:hypothetical protein
MRDTGGMVEHINPFKLSGLTENTIMENPIVSPKEPVKKIGSKSTPPKPKAKKVTKKKG